MLTHLYMGDSTIRKKGTLALTGEMLSEAARSGDAWLDRKMEKAARDADPVDSAGLAIVNKAAKLATGLVALEGLGMRFIADAELREAINAKAHQAVDEFWSDPLNSASFAADAIWSGTQSYVASVRHKADEVGAPYAFTGAFVDVATLGIGGFGSYKLARGLATGSRDVAAAARTKPPAAARPLNEHEIGSTYLHFDSPPRSLAHEGVGYKHALIGEVFQQIARAAPGMRRMRVRWMDGDVKRAADVYFDTRAGTGTGQIRVFQTARFSPAQVKEIDRFPPNTEIFDSDAKTLLVNLYRSRHGGKGPGAP